MDGPFHDFLLVDSKQYDYSQYMELIHHPSSVRIGDDVIFYIGDSLQWISSYKPPWRNKKEEAMSGLNLYGPTVIKSEGAKVAESVFDAWISLFGNAPDNMTLRGPFEGYEGSLLEEGDYSVLKLRRDELLDSLTKISDSCRIVQESNDRMYLLHLGV
jgi:hypothetical protein